MANSELACVYAALILADDDVAVTPEKITTILKVLAITIRLVAKNCANIIWFKWNRLRLLVSMLSPTGLASSLR